MQQGNAGLGLPRGEVLLGCDFGVSSLVDGCTLLDPLGARAACLERFDARDPSVGRRLCDTIVSSYFYCVGNASLPIRYLKRLLMLPQSHAAFI